MSGFSPTVHQQPASRIARARHSTELTARATEWQTLATALEQRTAAWSAECARWAEQRDQRGAISSVREQWVTDQTQQLAGWLRLAANHLLTLAANEPS
jgi:hypothetical protein